jgi:hypothetical protein
VPEPHRDLQRRPRGVFENVASKDEDDVTACSNPYDENSANGRVRSKAGIVQIRNQNVHHGHDRNISEVKYLESLQVIEKQKKSLFTLENQLDEALLELQTVKSDLQRSKDEATKRSQVFEEATSRVFRERIDTDERLRKEIQANQHLKDELACLEREVADLSLELERAHQRSIWSTLQRSDSAGIALADELSASSLKSDPINVKETEQKLRLDKTALVDRSEPTGLSDEARKSIESLTEKLLASEANVTNLQTQLSEAQATEVRLNQTVAHVTRSRDQALDEVSLLKLEMMKSNEGTEDLKRMMDLYDKEKQETSRLMKEIESLRNSLYESNLNVTHYSSSLKKLEGEFTRLQLDAARYEIQVSTLERQLLQEKENNCNMSRRSDSEMYKFRLEDKHKLEQTASELIRQAAEHLKERKRMDVEVMHRCSPIVPDAAIKGESEALNAMDESYGEKPSFVNCDTSETKRGSSDLLDILRMRLDQT